MREMLTLLAIFGIFNGLLGIFVLQKLYKDGASLIDRLSTAMLICGSVALSASTLSDYYLWRNWNHWPETVISIAVLARLCLRLMEREDTYPIRPYRGSYPIH